MFKKNMAEIVKIKKDGVIQYPITKPECVIDENGKNVLQLIKENGGGSSYDDTEVKNELARLEREKANKSEIPTKMSQLEQDVEIGSSYDDTKLKEEIADTYATKEYVDEAVANAGGGGEGCECATPDWSAPEGKEGHILNRTHYKDVEIYDSTFKYNEDGEALTPKYARLRDDYGNLSDLLPVSDDFEEFLDGFPLYDEYGDTTGYASGTLIVQPYNHTIRFDSDYEDEHYYVESVYESLKQLDEEFIPDTIARKSELTELSAEVSELRENASLFEAVYRETTRDEIIAAAEAKRHIICFYNNRIYNLTRYNPQGDLFFTCADNDVYTVICALNGSWSASTFAYMKQSSVVKNITDSSTDTQYPSAKAVYDFVNNTLGTIINGDY